MESPSGISIADIRGKAVAVNLSPRFSVSLNLYGAIFIVAGLRSQLCKSRGDNHPLCWSCSEELGIELCSPQNTMPQTPDVTSALTERALSSIGGGIADLARLQSGLSHQITLYRRDTALWDTNKSGISRATC